MDVLVVIPTYNEAENIEKLMGELLALGMDLDVLVVDDGSPDGTGDLADGMSERNDNVHVMHRSGKLGLGSAYVEGFKWGLANTNARVMVQMDADFSHPVEKVPQLASVAARGTGGGWLPVCTGRRSEKLGPWTPAFEPLGQPVFADRAGAQPQGRDRRVQGLAQGDTGRH